MLLGNAPKVVKAHVSLRDDNGKETWIDIGLALTPEFVKDIADALKQSGDFVNHILIPAPAPIQVPIDFDAMRLQAMRDALNAAKVFTGTNSRILNFGDKYGARAKVQASQCEIIHPDDIIELYARLKEIKALEDRATGAGPENEKAAD